MKVTLQTVALLPLLVSSAIAGTADVTCRTELGTKSVKKVPTTTIVKTSTRQPTVTSKVTPVVTKSVAHWYTVTAWTTKTETFTDTTVTDTFSTTTTLYTVRTLTDTSTVTTTKTSTSTTSSVSTTTIATTPGYRFIQDTVSTTRLSVRDVTNPHAPRAPAKRKGVLASTYPAKVDCTKSVPNTNTQTVSTTVAASTKTVPYWKKTTETDTISTTSTLVPPDVSVTETYTSISSVTTTTTVFATNTWWTSTTTTSVLPGPTVYSACDPRNKFGVSFNNGGTKYYVTNVINNGPAVGSDFKTVADGAESPEACCYSCMQFGTCETWMFRPGNLNCFLVYHEGETCTSQRNHPNFFMSKEDEGQDPDSAFIVGNGLCGFTYSGNSDGSIFPPQ